MFNNMKSLIFLMALFAISGCSSKVNRTLSPPSYTKWVYVEVKNPSPFTQPFPLEVRYISKECLKRRISGFDGSIITEPSYNAIRVPLLQASNNVWKAKVAMSGGGSCKWTLSAVNLGIKYIDATHLGKELVPGTSVGMTIAFDNYASRNGQFSLVSEANFHFSPKYYPLIKTNKMVHFEDTLNLFGSDDFLKVKLISANPILTLSYSPQIDESQVVRMVAPEQYKVGEFFKFFYPNGKVISDGSTHPDVKLLE